MGLFSSRAFRDEILFVPGGPDEILFIPCGFSKDFISFYFFFNVFKDFHRKCKGFNGNIIDSKRNFKSLWEIVRI